VLVVLSSAIATLKRAVYLLSQDEQLRVVPFGGNAWVKNGPGAGLLNPFGYREYLVRKVATLGPLEYAVVRSVAGADRIERGPQQLFLGAYDEQLGGVRTAVSLTRQEYVVVTNRRTGEKTVMEGPRVYIPGPDDQASRHDSISLSSTDSIVVKDHLVGKSHLVKGPCVWVPKHADEEAMEQRQALVLQSDEYVKIQDRATGKRWVERGEQIIFLEPLWAAIASPPVQKAFALKKFEYVRLVDSISSKVVVHRGEQTVFPGPFEELVDGKKLSAVELKVNDFVKVLDQATGTIRVERGQQLVFLGPTERFMGKGVQKAVEIDDDHAVLVRDKSTGQLRLETEKQLFVPGPDEVIEDVRELIKLSDHEAVIVKNKDGTYSFFYGAEEMRKNGEPRSFFLPPYCELVTMWWSRGRRREIRDLAITRFDTRAQFMNFEFNSRTSDNVELILEGCFFWQVCKLPEMISTTGDASGDICAHARSQFIQLVSRVTLKDFMNNLHELAKRVHESDSFFYDVRGIKVHSLEVTRFQCAEASVSAVLEEIIQETTNRMNRLSQAESENEVALFRMQGEIEQEKLNSSLLEIQNAHAQQDATVEGTVEADRSAGFLSGLEKEVKALAARIEMWKTLRKQQAMEAITQGGAKFYYTPSGSSITITSKER
jgi:hypothetical protein